VITSAGYRIGPGPIEDCLLGHPAVRLAAVIGVPDATRTEIVKAFIVLNEGFTAGETLVRDIQEHVKTRLAAHEYPRAITFVDSLPMTATGKIVRRALRDAEPPAQCRDAAIGYSDARLQEPISAMTSDTPTLVANARSPLYVKLLGETAKIDWIDLEQFFARGMLLRVARDLDLVSVAEAIATDDTQQVAQWISAGLVERLRSETAADFATRDPELWAVVVSPWVCVQERN
jgi:hypothetical protein